MPHFQIRGPRRRFQLQVRESNGSTSCRGWTSFRLDQVQFVNHVRLVFGCDKHQVCSAFLKIRLEERGCADAEQVHVKLPKHTRLRRRECRDLFSYLVGYSSLA